MVLAVTLLSVLGLIAAYDGTLLSNDTAQYLSVANHLVKGQGLKTDLVFFSEHLALADVPVEQTVFPPGYPWLIGIPASLGIPVPDAAFVVAASAFALVPAVLYLLGISLGQSPAWALTGALLWVGLVDNWFITLERQPEIPFVLLTLLALLAIPEQRTERTYLSALAGLFAAAAILVRYAGFFFVGAAAAVLAAQWIRHRSTRSALRLAGFLTGPTLTMLWLFWRNLQLVGDLKGGNAYQEVKPLGLVVLKFYKALCHILGFTGSGLKEPRLGELLLVISILAAGVVWIRYRKTVSFVPLKQPNGLHQVRLFIAVAYIGLSVVLLFYLELTTSLDFQPRMILVLAPFFLITATQVLSAMKMPSGPARTAYLLLGVLILTTFAAGQRNVLHQMRARPNLFLLVEEALSVEIDEVSVKRLLQEKVSADHPLLGNEPQMLGAVLGRAVVGLEPPYYTDRKWTADEVRELIDSYGIEYVVFMPEILEISSEKPAFFTQLAKNGPPGWLEIVSLNPSLTLYRVK